MAERCLCGQSSCHLAGPPGTVGSLLLGGDKSIVFWRDPLGFIESNAAQLNSRIFRTRLAVKPTLVLADHAAVVAFSNSSAALADFENGLKENYAELFGHSIMFATGDDALFLRFGN
jgi:hypothetical protein